MSTDHRRPLFAFFVVASLCALVVTLGVRPAGLVDILVGRAASPEQALAPAATLEPRTERPTNARVVAERPSRTGQHARPSAKPNVKASSDRTSRQRSGDRLRSGDGRLPAQASGRAHGGGKPGHAGGARSSKRPSAGHRSGHGSRNRVGDIHAGVSGASQDEGRVGNRGRGKNDKGDRGRGGKGQGNGHAHPGKGSGARR